MAEMIKKNIFVRIVTSKYNKKVLPEKIQPNMVKKNYDIQK
jgi:hypothetical protein